MALGLNISCILLPTSGSDFRAPLIGVIVVGAAEPFTVLWSNGQLTGNVSAATIEEIGDATDATVALVGQQVRLTGFSPDLRGTVIAAYQRDPDDSQVDTIVVRNFANGEDYTFPASLVSTENT